MRLFSIKESNGWHVKPVKSGEEILLVEVDAPFLFLSRELAQESIDEYLKQGDAPTWKTYHIVEVELTQLREGTVTGFMVKYESTTKPFIKFPLTEIETVELLNKYGDKAEVFSATAELKTIWKNNISAYYYEKGSRNADIPYQVEWAEFIRLWEKFKDDQYMGLSESQEREQYERLKAKFEGK